MAGIFRVSPIELISELVKRQFNMAGKRDRAHVTAQDVAIVLPTSGSEGVPKLVPLTHENQMVNAKDVVKEFELTDQSRYLNALPDFHSFGSFLSNLAEAAGVPTFLTPDPMNGAQIAKEIEYNKISHIALTPTFASNLANNAKPGQLSSLKVILIGAAPLTPELVQQLRKVAPNASILEGYGITETSPVLSVNRVHDARFGTLGRELPSVKTMVVRPEHLEAYQSEQKKLNALRAELGELAAKGAKRDVLRRKSEEIDAQKKHMDTLLWDEPRGKKGIVLAAGKSVFGGYLNRPSDENVFVEFRGQRYYITNDYGRKFVDDHLKYEGRKARELKLSGERIALEDLEKALEASHPPDRKGPTIAIQSTDAKADQDLYVFTTDKNLDRATATRQLHANGGPSVATIKGVIHMDELPMLGSGKVNYNVLKTLVKDQKVIAAATQGAGGAQQAAPPAAPKVLTRGEAQALVQTFGRLPVEKINGKDVDLEEAENALTLFQRPAQQRHEVRPEIAIHPYEVTDPATGTRSIAYEAQSTMHLDVTEANRALQAAGLPSGFKISRVSKVGYVEKVRRPASVDIDGQTVDLRAAEGAFQPIIDRRLASPPRSAPTLYVRAFNGPKGERRLEVVTSVPMTVEAANQKLHAGGVAKEVTISRVSQVGFIPLTPDGSRPAYDIHFQLPNGLPESAPQEAEGR